jgi:hypothetical protein
MTTSETNLEDDTLTRICVSMCRKVADSPDAKTLEWAERYRSQCRSGGDDEPTPTLLSKRSLLYPW